MRARGSREDVNTRGEVNKRARPCTNLSPFPACLFRAFESGDVEQAHSPLGADVFGKSLASAL